MIKDMPKQFETFTEARKNGFIQIKDLKELGTNIVGTYCVYSPMELIYAAGAVPISLCGMSEEPIHAAEKILPRNLCPLIKSSFGFAVTDTCPYFYFADMIIGETTCDGKKKMYELMSEYKPMHIMELPNSKDSDYAFPQWRSEMVKLKEKLETEFNTEITEEKLRESIKLRNQERTILREFYELGKMNPPAITGQEMLKVLYGTGFITDKSEQNKMLKEMIEEVNKKYEAGERVADKDAPRILVTGCPVGGATEKIIKQIEDNGGVVVCFENCSGVKEKMTLVDETKDPIDALTEKYLNIPCSCLSPNDDRMTLIGELIDEYEVDGVVDIILQACHTYNIEGYKVNQYVNKEKNVPYISVETTYSDGDIGQLSTRLAAFIEMIG